MQGHKLIKRISFKERYYIKKVLDGNFTSSVNGLMLKKFEEAFAKIIGRKYAIGHINGTATLHSSLFAAGVEAGDEVIIPPLTMSSTAFAVLQQDAIPIFADVNKDTFDISPRSVERLISPRTKAIITVSLYGLSPDMDSIMTIAKRYNICVIEDDAQCLLGQYKGRMVGTLGDLASFSFQSSKHMTSGEGGIVCTDSYALAEKVRKFSVLGYASVGADKGKITKNVIQNPDYERHVCLGYNYRMPDLCAAVLLGQLERLDELVQRRIDVANLFLKVMKNCQWLIPQKINSNLKHSYWSFAVRLMRENVQWSQFRKKFMEFGGDGIYSAWKLSYLEPIFQTMNFSGKNRFMVKLYKKQFQSYKKGLCPFAEEIQPQILAFKTDYWDWRNAEEQAEILYKTIKFFGY